MDDGFSTAFTNPVLEIRTGAQPASADDAITGSLLCEVSLPASNYFAASSGGVKLQAGSWSGTVQSSGTAGWFRIKNGADTDGSSTTLPRIDGTLSEGADADIVLSSVTLVVSDTLDVTGFYLVAQAGQLAINSTGILA